jgi:hypothetical protein
MQGFAEKLFYAGGFPRRGAKTQSAAAFLRGFLCVFAPLREKCLLSHVKNAAALCLPANVIAPSTGDSHE